MHGMYYIGLDTAPQGRLLPELLATNLGDW